MEQTMKALYILLIVLTVFAVQAKATPSVKLELPEQLSKETLPAFTAKNRDATKNFQKRHLEQLVEPETERIALVYFATWCKPCTEGATMLRKAKKKLEKEGILIIFVNVGERDVDVVQKWIKKHGDPDFPLIMDTRAQMVVPFGLSDSNTPIALPKTLILDKNLKPLFLLGTEGDDFPEVLWKFNP